jgi:hypothetical protein
VDVLSRRDLEDLLKERKPPCVSIYMPAHQGATQVDEDPLRLKNLLKEAESSLEAMGYAGRDLAAVLGPPRTRILRDTMFWKYQGKGLALFLARDQMKSYRLPAEFEQMAVVGERYHLKPLLPMLGRGERFFVLALNLKKTRLISATRFNALEINPGSAPISLVEALKYDDREKELQFHSGAPEKVAGNFERSAIFHGHGSEKDARNREIMDFFIQLDRGISGTLKEQHAPLVVAGVQKLFGFYRKANSYRYLVESGFVHGSPDGLSPEELRDKALKIVEPIFQRESSEAAERFMNMLGGQRASSDLAEVVAASANGRVDTLFVPLNENRWGTTDEGGTNVVVFAEPKPGSRDLLDFAAIQTLLHDGNVLVPPAEEMPGGNSIAAIYRY